MRQITSRNVPNPGGHYAHAVVSGHIIYVSGQLPIDPAEPSKQPGTIQEQTWRVLQQIEEIVKAAGSAKEGIVRTTIYITDITHWKQVNRIYGDFFGSHYPARTVVPVKELHYGCAIEMDAIAEVMPE